MDRTPLISVVIPAYNQARFLSTCFESVVQQTHFLFEIILIDDGSTDETPLLCLEWKKREERLHYFRQENQGLSLARNAGISQAKGEYICLLDSDDLMHPQRLELQLESFRKNPATDIVYTAVEVIDEEGEALGMLRREWIAPENFLAEEFFRNQIPTPSTLMAKTHCLVEATFHPDYRCGEDYEWILRAAHRYQFEYLDLPLTSYRRHGSNLSENLPLLREAEIQILQSYGTAHILEVVERTSYTQSEKELLKGKILYIMERYEEAIEKLSSLNTPLGLFYLGNCYFAQSEWVKAQETYERTVRLDPLNPALFNNLGLIYATLHSVRKGETCFEKAAKLKMGYLDPEKNLRALAEKRPPTAFTRRELRKDLLPYQK